MGGTGSACGVTARVTAMMRSNSATCPAAEHSAPGQRKRPARLPAPYYRAAVWRRPSSPRTALAPGSAEVSLQKSPSIPRPAIAKFATPSSRRHRRAPVAVMPAGVRCVQAENQHAAAHIELAGCRKALPLRAPTALSVQQDARPGPIGDRHQCRPWRLDVGRVEQAQPSTHVGPLSSGQRACPSLFAE